MMKIFKPGYINLKNILFINFLIALSFSLLSAQSITVSGRVTSSRIPVKNVQVTFINNADTSISYSAITSSFGEYQISIPTSIEPILNKLPEDFELAQNYPNPFSSSTSISYHINAQAAVKVTIYDVLGREVRKFVIGDKPAGSYRVMWDGRNRFGEKVANGIYLYKLQVGTKSLVKKMIFSSTGSAIGSPLQTNFSHKTRTNNSSVVLLNDETYTVRVDNTENTLPLIIPVQLENIIVKSDTSISFTVDNVITAAIDPDDTQQHITGFGAAFIHFWRPDMTDSEIETAFGTGDGQLGFTILRLGIDPNPNRWGENLHTAKKAQEMGALIFASPWNAPDDLLIPNTDEDTVAIDKYDEYAKHLDDFNTFMADNGVDLYAISVQNEPDYAHDWTGWDAQGMLKFMRENAPSIGTRVMAPESFQFRRNMSDPILNDSLACANLDIVGGHIYGGGLAPYPLAEEKGKEVWMTEHLSGENSTPDDWSWVMSAAIEINDVMHANMSAYIWWYLVRYYGPISDGTYLRKGEVTPKGYMMSQFSKFIRPGDFRVESAVYPATSKIYVTAYTDSLFSKTVIVAINSNASDKEIAFSMKNGTAQKFIPYTTSETKNVEQGDTFTTSDNTFFYTLDASSITTFVSE